MSITKFGGAAADVAGEHAAEVVAIGVAVVGSDLIDAVGGEQECTLGEAEAGGGDVGSGRGAQVLAEPGGEAVRSHADAAREAGDAEIGIGVVFNQVEQSVQWIGEGRRERLIEIGEGEMEGGGAVMKEATVAEMAGGLVHQCGGCGEGVSQQVTDWNGLWCAEAARGRGEGEVDVKVIGRMIGAAVEEAIGGYENDVVGVELNGASGSLNKGSGGQVVVEPPKGAVDAVMMPVGQLALIAADVDQKVGGGDLSDTGEVDTFQGGEIEVVGRVLCHRWAGRWI